MRWFLHIGAPKTGSTAIQRFLFENRAALLEHGVEYPDVSLRGFGHHDLAFLLHGRYADWASSQPLPLDHWRDVLRDAVRATSADAIVLSSEIFHLYPEPAAAHALLTYAGLRPDDEVAVICYVRRQDDAHVSWYNQTVKAQGNAASFEETVARDHGLWNYAERLAPWQAAFGAAAIRVRDYTPFSQPTHDIRGDFLDILGVPRSAFDLPPARENERINRDILDFQRWVNRLPLTHARKRQFHKQLIALTAASAGKGVFDDTPFLSAPARTALLQSYAEDNRRLALTYGGGAPLFAPLGEDAVAMARPSARKGLTIPKLLHILAWIAGQHRQFRTVR